MLSGLRGGAARERFYRKRISGAAKMIPKILFLFNFLKVLVYVPLTMFGWYGTMRSLGTLR